METGRREEMGFIQGRSHWTPSCFRGGTTTRVAQPREQCDQTDARFEKHRPVRSLVGMFNTGTVTVRLIVNRGMTVCVGDDGLLSLGVEHGEADDNCHDSPRAGRFLVPLVRVVSSFDE